MVEIYQYVLIYIDNILKHCAVIAKYKISQRQVRLIQVNRENINADAVVGVSQKL